LGTSPKQTKSASYDSSSATASTPFPTDADSTNAPVVTELVENSTSIKNNETTVDTDVPITEEPAETITIDANSNSFVIETPSEIPIPNTEEATEIVEDSTTEDTSDEACLAVAVQEPPPLDSSSKEDNFAMTVDVVYQESSITPADISSYLNEQNIAMALWIVGCEAEATDATTAIETAEGKRRRFLEDLSIAYSQVDSWGTTGDCIEDANDANLCQQGFASSIQLYASEDASMEELANQIAEAFSATSKPFLESQDGVVGVSVRDIVSETTKEASANDIQTNPSQPNGVQRSFSTTRIIMGTVAGACLLSSLILFILIGTYKRRQRDMGSAPRTNKDVAHVPFEDEFDGDADGIDRITVKTRQHGAEQMEDQLSDDDRTPSPCHNAPGVPVPYDERKLCSSPTCPDCERLRQEGIVGRSQSAPVQFSAPNTITTSASFEPQWWKLHPNSDASRRNYGHEDKMEL